MRAANDERSDVFSFGTVLYELLAGSRPFGGDTQADIIAAVLRDAPPPLKSTRPEIPESVTLVIDRCLPKESGGAISHCRRFQGGPGECPVAAGH